MCKIIYDTKDCIHNNSKKLNPNLFDFDSYLKTPLLHF